MRRKPARSYLPITAPVAMAPTVMAVSLVPILRQEYPCVPMRSWPSSYSKALVRRACRPVGRANSWGGVLSTAGGVVFFGDDSGAFTAVDAENGKVLWSFAANARWRASPMTYQFDGHQYVGVANGSTIMAFALPQAAQ